MDLAIIQISTADTQMNCDDVWVDPPMHVLIKIAMFSMQSCFEELFINGLVSRRKAYINSTFTIATRFAFFNHDIAKAFRWNYDEYPPAIEILMERLATSSMVSFQSFEKGRETVNGTALSAKGPVFVRWVFSTAPHFLMVDFLGSVVYQSSSYGPNL